MNFINSLDLPSLSSSPSRNIVNFGVIAVLARATNILSPSLFLSLSFDPTITEKEKARDPIYYGNPTSHPLSRKSITSNEYNMKGIKG